MDGCELSVQNLNVSAGQKNILSHVDFDLRERSVTALMGPMGGGKSTFLKFLSGAVDKSALSTKYDKARYRGAELGKNGFPRLIRQKTRESASGAEKSRVLAEERIDEIDRVCDGNSDALCIDEPTAGLADDDGARLMQHLGETAKSRPVLIVSHNSGQVREFCDHVALFGGGHILAHMPSAAFFSAEEGSHPERFLRTGGLDLPSADTPVQMLSSKHRPLPSEFDPGAARKGLAQTWIIPGKLDLRALAVDESGQLRQSGDIDRDHFICNIFQTRTVIEGDSGVVFEEPWRGELNRPDQDTQALTALCREIDRVIAGGGRITLNASEYMVGAAAILGSFMVMRGASPEDALTVAAAKLPDLHFGMRMEQLFWDMDIAFGV